jgi:hypothetical protein
MKRVVGATFLVFYAAFTVVAISQHTASYASTINRHSPVQSKSIRAASPHTPQVRILQEPFVGMQIRTTVALPDSGRTLVPPPSPRFEFDFKRFTPTRAPPASL